jgi:hypothetical protein
MLCAQREVHNIPKESRALILKHFMEAEKSTFRGELSFQRSAGFTVATIFCFVLKTVLWNHVEKHKIR